MKRTGVVFIAGTALLFAAVITIERNGGGLMGVEED